MKLADPATTFEGALPAGTRLTFQLKSNPKMFAILSDGIYADKISAVIRELSCNAHDSNVMARSPRPFIVNVPTSLETNFWVEDTGLGIDPDKIVDIFWTYGASTKTDSNETIGALGLGSKSPFAYTKSSFLVVNRYNGMEYKYFCFINEVGIPDGKLVYQTATTEPNGVRVELAVRSDDVRAFRERIIRFFSFWDKANLPEFHGDTSVTESIDEIKAHRKIAGTNWELRGVHDDVGSGAYAVMGGVPYPINRRALTSPSQALQMICESNVNITFPMGSLDFQVSREELSYTDETLAALEAGAKNIVKDVLSASKAKLVGIATPHALGKAYRVLLGELHRSFRYVGTLLARETFELADGRKFRGEQLTTESFRVSHKSHLPFSIHSVERQMRDYSKGTQYYALESELYVELSQPEVIDPTTKKVVRRASHNVIPWFKVNTSPAPWTNQNRKRTAANYLHDGFVPTGSRFDYQGRQSMEVAFIINDLADRGVEGIRFYKSQFPAELARAYADSHLYFIDGFASAMTVDAVEAGLKEFVANTQLEGAPVMRLSQLPNFKLPEAPKVEPKVRNPVQRGTIEQRMMVHIFENPKLPTEKPRYTIEFAEDFELQFRASNGTKTEYARHLLTKPMLYVDTNWGVPTTDFDKKSVEQPVIGALYSLGLLDEFVTPTATGFEIRIGMLSPNHVEEMKRRNVTLVSFKDIQAKVIELFNQQGALIQAFQERAGGFSHDDDRMMLSRLLSKHFIKHGLKHLPSTNKIAMLTTVHDRIKAMLRGDHVRNALLFLIYKGWNGSMGVQGARLQGLTKVGELLETYPLLKTLSFAASHDSEKVTHEHIAAYINMIDAAKVQAAEAARLDTLAALHAEALFETN